MTIVLRIYDGKNEKGNETQYNVESNGKIMGINTLHVNKKLSPYAWAGGSRKIFKGNGLSKRLN